MDAYWSAKLVKSPTRSLMMYLRGHAAGGNGTKTRYGISESEDEGVCVCGGWGQGGVHRNRKGFRTREDMLEVGKVVLLLTGCLLRCWLTCAARGRA